MKQLTRKRIGTKPSEQSILQAFTAAALALPGLLAGQVALAADDDEIDFGYSHYQEGLRQGNNLYRPNANTGVFKNYALPKPTPIEADSLFGRGRITVTDRLKFGFNFTQDTWAGATPYGSAPENSGAYGSKHLNENIDANGDFVISEATPLAGGGSTLMDDQGHFYSASSIDADTGVANAYHRDRIAHVMGYASPETRKQGDFNLAYDWDDTTTLNIGGGVSNERDYQSSFCNLGGQWAFNQKRTTLSFSQSYTHDDINATNLSMFPIMHPLATMPQGVSHPMPQILASRQDWNSQLGLTQVMNQNALLSLGMGFSRNTGFLANPYKISWMGGLDPNEALVDGLHQLHGFGFYERRPDARNLWSWRAGWTQYLPALDAALHFNYQFSHDDWRIDAHTFDADWVQPLGQGWTLTPRVRYYSQSAASFYQPYFVVTGHFDPASSSSHFVFDNLPSSFSSDQRLSGYGAISGGLTLAKQFAKGITLETSFEYYSHQGKLKMGGGGEQAFADYDFWMANANLKLNLGAMGRAFDGGDEEHRRHAQHGNVPAGLMFAHMLDRAGDFMAGYRYQHNRQAGGWLHKDHAQTEQQAIAQGCPDTPRFADDGNTYFDGPCLSSPKEMTQSMHMLELMYAPSDWLTLMLMPQFMDMQMTMGSGAQQQMTMQSETGGIGDTGFYGLVSLFKSPNHSLHLSLGGTAPTGDVANKRIPANTTSILDNGFVEYGMQLGSGTWDLKPGLTYSGQLDSWSWGAQVLGTKRMAAANASGYRLGDLFESSLWGGYSWTDWLSSSVRLAYTWQDAIHGRYPRDTRNDAANNSACDAAQYTYGDPDYDHPDADGNPIIGPAYLHQVDYNACLANAQLQTKIDDASYRLSAMDHPRNYGGHYLDLGLGVAVTIPDGAFAGHRLAFEWQQPLYTKVNGYQLDRDHALTFTWSYGF